MTLRRSITELKNRHAGQDLWVIAAAASMDFVSPAFFQNKITIGVNQVFRHFPCTYLVRKEKQLSHEAYDSGIPLILSEFDCGSRGAERNEVPGPAWYFDHPHNNCETIDLSPLGTDQIVVSYSTIGSAIHVAAYMGAANIILCGHDGGLLDGRLNYEGYYTESIDTAWYRGFVQRAVQQTRQLRDRIREVYGCEIYSLNPFLGFDLEGHRFEC